MRCYNIVGLLENTRQNFLMKNTSFSKLTSYMNYTFKIWLDLRSYHMLMRQKFDALLSQLS